MTGNKPRVIIFELTIENYAKLEAITHDVNRFCSDVIMMAIDKIDYDQRGEGKNDHFKTLVS